MFNDTKTESGTRYDTTLATMADILGAAGVLTAPGHPLLASYSMTLQICERLYPTVDPASIRIGLSDDKAMSPFMKNVGWVRHHDGIHVITVLMRHHRDIEQLFCSLLHEINHVRQHQISGGKVFSTQTLHRVESWRQAAYEAANALWPGVFDASEFMGVPGRRSKTSTQPVNRLRLDDETLHRFPNVHRERVEESGQAFIPKWCYI